MAEMVDGKQVQQPASAVFPSVEGKGFRLFSRFWVGLIGLCWAATLAHFLSQMTWLGSASIKIGGEFLSPGALLAGGVVAAILIWMLLGKFGNHFVVEKPGLGKWVRLSAYAGIAAMSLFGCYAFYMSPSIASSWWRDVFPPIMVFGKGIALKPVFFPSVGIFATVMLVVFLLLNREKWADFLIDTEGEIKKVSWPARKEYLGSSMVVVLVVAVVSIFLHFVDLGLSRLMEKMGIGF
jgi:preprotein translocase SecE subunit